MIHVERNYAIDASPEAVWAVLGDYMHVDDFAPLVVSVDAMTNGADGLGSKRRNHFENGSSIVEEVTDWKPGKGFTVEMLDMDPIPLKKASSSVAITQEGKGSKVKWTIDFRAKYGPLGWLMGQTLMKSAMGKVIDGNLKGLEESVLSQRQ